MRGSILLVNMFVCIFKNVKCISLKQWGNKKEEEEEMSKGKSGKG